MKPESFLKNFGHVVNAPNGVQSIRDMVLGLAVTGRLSTTHETDTAAEECFRRCRNHYERLVAEGRLRLEPARSGAVTTDSFGLIPVTWVWSTIGEVTSYGSTEKAEFVDVSPSTWVLELEDIEKGTSKIVAKIRAGERRFKSSKNRFSPGQVLYGKLRPYLDKVVIADEPGVCTTEIVPILAFDGLEPEYLHLFLKSPRFRTFATNSTHGMNLPRLGTSAARSAPFPLPPLEEQKRIVTKVDELMRLCDRLEAQQQEREKLLPLLSRANHTRFAQKSTEANLQAIFGEPGNVSPEELGKSICSLAVSGRIVSPQCNDDDVLTVLSRYDIDAVDPQDAPILPKHWKWVRLGDATATMNSGWSPTCPPKPANPDQWGVLKTTAVQTLEYLEHENKVLPTNLEPRPEAEVHDGDILLTRAGPSNRVGIICVARPTRPKLMISDKIIRLHLIKEILPDFGALVLNTGYTSECIAKLKSGMAASQMNISQPKLRSVPIPVPPAGEQRLILERVAHLLTLVRRLAEQKRKRSEVLEAFAKAAIVDITSTEFMENEMVQPPRTEVATALKLGNKPKKAEVAPLAKLLSELEAEASAKALWQLSGLEIDAFYRQLKSEMANGWIEEDTSKRAVKEVEVG